MQGKPMAVDDLIEELNASQVASSLCTQAAARLATYEAALREIDKGCNQGPHGLSWTEIKQIARKALDTP